MSNEVREANKQADRKAKKSFFLLLVLGAIVGGFVGFGSAWLRDWQGTDNFLIVLENTINQMSFYAGLVTSAVVAIVNMVLYRQSRVAFEAWDEEDEEALLIIDRKLSVATMLANVNLIFTYIFMPIGFTYWIDMEDVGVARFVKAGIFLMGVILAMVVTMMTSAKVVNLEKEMNPEKEGSAYDVKFQSKWMNSSDEAEKLVVYKAAYKSYKVINVTCMVLWASCMFGMLLLDWGMIPVFMIGIIWMASFLGYYAETIRLSKNGSKIQE